MTRLRQIENGEARVTKHHAAVAVGPHALVIRPAVPQALTGIHHQLAHVVPRLPRAYDTAHQSPAWRRD